MVLTKEEGPAASTQRGGQPAEGGRRVVQMAEKVSGQRLRDADLGVFEAIEAELPAWLAERWQAVGGPGHYRPAYLVFHGGLDEPRYDLEQLRWCEVEEVWPEEASG